MAVELAAAYVSIIPETSKIAPGVRSALTNVQRDADSQGASMGSRIGSGIAKTLKRGAVAAGVVAGGALGTAITKGLGRLNGIEQAEAKLSGLGHSAQSVGSIMDNALASVKGTSYGLADAATVAASAVAAGVRPGQDLERTLKLVGDAAAIAGVGMDEMGSIFNKVAAGGKAQMDVINQLSDRGVPILQMLADEMGVTAEEAAKMASEGKVNFDIFRDAMESGVSGAALKMGDTVQGALANTGAAAGRLGAVLAGPFFSQAAGALGGVTEHIDRLTDKAGPMMDQVAGWIENRAVPAFSNLGNVAPGALSATGSAISSVASAAVALAPPLFQIVGAFAQVAGAISVATWTTAANAINGVASAVGLLEGPLSLTAGLINDNQGAVTALALGWAAMKFAPPLAKKLGDALEPMKERASALGEMRRNIQDFSRAHPEMTKTAIAAKLLGDNGHTSFAQIAAGADRGAQSLARVASQHRVAASAAKVQALQSKDLFLTMDRIGAQAWHSLVASTASGTQFVGSAVGGMTSAVKVGFNGAKTAVQGLATAMGGPLGLAVTGAVTAVSALVIAHGDAKRSAEAMAKATSDAVKAQRELRQVVAGTTGEIGADGLAAATQIATAELDKLFESGSKSRGFWNSVGSQLEIMAGQSDVAYNTARQLKYEYNELEEVAGEMGMTMEDVAEAVASGSSKYYELIDKLREAGYNSQEAADKLEKMREQIEENIASAQRISAPMAAASDAIRDIGDQAGTAESRVENFHRAMMGLQGIQVDAQEAASQLSREIETFGSDMERFAGTVQKANGEIDIFANTASREAYDSVSSLTERMRQAVASGNDVGTVFNEAAPELLRFAESTGLGVDGLQLLLHTMGMTPEQLSIYAAVESDQAMANVQMLKTTMEAWGEDIFTKPIVIEGGGEAIQAVKDLGFELDVINEETGEVQITAITDEAHDNIDEILASVSEVEGLSPEVIALFSGDAALEGLGQVQDGMNDLDNFTANPDAHLDTDPISFGIDQSNQWLDDLGNTTATATGDLNNSPLYTNASFAHTSLDGVDNRRPTPVSFVDNGPLDNAVGDAHGALDGVDGRRPVPISDLENNPLNSSANQAHTRIDTLDGERPTPIADMNNNPLSSGIRDSRNWLRNFLNDFGSITVNATLNAVRNIFTRHHGGQVPEVATGGRLPALAGGGKLPVHGPGTSTVDGILGVDNWGMPTARVDAGEWVVNSKSSAKWNNLIGMINRDDPRLAHLQGLQALASGGVVTAGDVRRFVEGESVGGVQMERSLDGAPYENFPGRSGAWGDCSYTQGRIAAFMLGINPLGARQFSTHSQEQWLRQHGAIMGKGGPDDAYRVGWNHSVHTSGTLPDGTNVEMGGGMGGGAIGRGAAGWDSPSYTNHAWIPTATNSASSEMLTYGPEGVTTAPGTLVDPEAIPLDQEASAAAERVTEAQADPNSPFYDTGANSISEAAGNLASSFVSGQVASLLRALSLPDTLPPLVQAGQQWYQLRQDEDGTDRDADQDREDLIAAADALDDLDAIESTGAAEPSPDITVDMDAPADDWGMGYFVREITKAAKNAGLDREAGIIGVGTGLVESGNPMLMYANNRVPESLDFRHDALGSDHDSVGLFQQRDNGAWGSVSDRMTPVESARMFFDVLSGFDWQSMGRGEAAQRVQRSAFPSKYEPQMSTAEDLVDQYGVFDRGGIGRGKGLLPKDVVEPERVLSPDQTRAFDDLVYSQLPDLAGLASTLTSSAITGGAGMAAAAANTVVPGSGAMVSMAAAPVSEMAGWYAGEVVGNLQHTAEQFGRDLLEIPRSMIDSVTTLPTLPGLDLPQELAAPTRIQLPPQPEQIDRRRTGDGDVHFHVTNDAEAYERGRKLAIKRSRGLIGARRTK